MVKQFVICNGHVFPKLQDCLIVSGWRRETFAFAFVKILHFLIGCATLQLLWRQSRQGPGDGMDPRAGWISIVSSTNVSTCLKINPQWKLWCIDFG